MFGTLGDKVKAKEYHEKSLAIALEISDRKTATFSYLSLGRIFLALGNKVMADECCERALSLDENTVKIVNRDFLCCCSLAMTKFSLGNIREAFSYLFRCIENYESLRGHNAESDQIKISLDDANGFPYWLLRTLFINTGNLKGALYATEMGRARALADLMATQYSAEKDISTYLQPWTGIKDVMKKESDTTCVYISHDDNEVFLWILKTSGTIYLRSIEVDKKTLHTRLAKVAEIWMNFLLS